MNRNNGESHYPEASKAMDFTGAIKENDPRLVLENLIRQHKTGYAFLSKMLGRNPTYIQQFIKRGSPRKLDEFDRSILAEHFGVPESVLVEGHGNHSQISEIIPIPIVELAECQDSQLIVVYEVELPKLWFSKKWLLKLGANQIKNLLGVRASGDAMNPTICNGDNMLVDLSERTNTAYDGVYVLRINGENFVRRISSLPTSDNVSISCDKGSYLDSEKMPLSEIETLGRVLWIDRFIS